MCSIRLSQPVTWWSFRVT
uniref:Uncharacterized protein n=1 Tax=Arundo donax TaxID=35708 RepID=A0A0A9GYR7_ARUDO